LEKQWIPHTNRRGNLHPDRPEMMLGSIGELEFKVAARHSFKGLQH
jgi:hypothetical protein